jgi:hypothetical protein
VLQLTGDNGGFAAEYGAKPIADQVRGRPTRAVIEVNLICMYGKTPPRGNDVPVPAENITLNGCVKQ